MATRPKKITATATPGQNAPVNRVVRFEDLLQKMQQGAAQPASGRAKASVKGAAALGSIQQLAAELEARMRELRRQSPDVPKGPPKGRTRPVKPKA